MKKSREFVKVLNGYKVNKLNPGTIPPGTRIVNCTKCGAETYTYYSDKSEQNLNIMCGFCISGNKRVENGK